MRRVTWEARTIGRNLQHLRERAGFSRRQTAHFLGISVQQLSKYEKGINRLTAEKLFWLNQFFNARYEEFFFGL